MKGTEEEMNEEQEGKKTSNEIKSFFLCHLHCCID
jgi:hypothetical protein